MPYYKTCQLCGAALDPGETCDCERERPAVDSNDIEPQQADVA